MISYDKKFIFIHINKTAGTSIEQALNSYGEKRIVPKNNTITAINSNWTPNALSSNTKKKSRRNNEGCYFKRIS